MVDAIALGVQAARAGRPGEAARWFRVAADAQPGDARILNWLGQALCADGQQVEGVVALRAAGLMLARAATPQERAPAMPIAAELQRRAAIDESLVVLDAVRAAEPDNAQAAYLRATALAQLNRPADALAAGRRALTLAGRNVAAALLVASLEHDAREDETAEKRVRALLAGSLPPADAHRARKLLAAILDRRGAHDAAFTELRAAEQLALALPMPDRALVPRLLAEAAAGYTPELLSRFAGHAFAGRAAPVFVIGFFRSGTTMMQQILGSHPDVFVSDEVPLIGAAHRALDAFAPSSRPMPQRLAELDAGGIQRLRDAYWAAARGRFGDAALDVRVFVDKFTMNTAELGFIATVFPDAKVLFLVRDPRDVCLSAYLQQMPPGPATAHLLTWEGTARFYAAVMDWWLAARERLPLAWHEVRYESLVEDFEGTLRPALAVAGLDWNEAVTRFHERGAGRYVSTPSRAQVTQPLYRTAVARWRRYEPAFAPIMPVLAPYVEAFGYPV